MSMSSKKRKHAYGPGIEPLANCADLPQMSLPDELRLCVDIENSVAVPVMTCSIDQVLTDASGVDSRISISGDRRMVVDAVPHIRAWKTVSKANEPDMVNLLPSMKAKFFAVMFRSPYLL
jgi:hypothetical protein